MNPEQQHKLNDYLAMIVAQRDSALNALAQVQAELKAAQRELESLKAARVTSEAAQ